MKAVIRQKEKKKRGRGGRERFLPSAFWEARSLLRRVHTRSGEMKKWGAEMGAYSKLSGVKKARSLGMRWRKGPTNKNKGEAFPLAISLVVKRKENGRGE